jgi:uncharacterized protein YkwD
MRRRAALAALAALALAACTRPPPPPAFGPDGLPLPVAYRIDRGEAQRIPFRMLDAVNALRAGAGVAPLTLDPRLTAAAETHSRDMAVQARPWHFGSDGSSPIDRARRAGFDGRLLGETISETYEPELETLTAWMEEPGSRAVILDPEARRMGFAWFQEENGKIWWTLNVGSGPEFTPIV